MKNFFVLSTLLLSILFIFFLFPMNITFAQSLSSCTFSASSGTYTQINGSSGAISPTLSGGSQDDGCYNSIPLGFTFLYLNINYTTISASTNGWMTFGQSISDYGYVNNLFSGGKRPLLAPLWDDLITPLGNFSYKTAGIAGSRTFTAEWLNVQWDFTGNTRVISFQVILYEGSNRIDFCYRQERNNPTSPSASIGITSANTGVGNFLSLDSTGLLPNVSSSVETNNIQTRPATGQIYSFSFPPPPTPVASEDWVTIADNDTANHGQLTLDKYSDESIKVSGILNFIYGSSAVQCVISTGSATIVDTAISIIFQGTATSPSAPAGYQYSDFTETSTGGLHNGKSSGTYTITFSEYGWPPEIDGIFTSTRISGSGVTGGAVSVKGSTINVVPKAFTLFQNYPNPFNPSTNISFSLPSRSFVSLKVFDLLGKEVATIVSEEMSAGSYSKQWNASKFASGVYFYRLQAGSFTEIKKLLFLK